MILVQVQRTVSALRSDGWVESRGRSEEAAASTLPPETPATQLPEVYELMRWFQLPHEEAGFLRHKNGPCRRPGGRGED